MAQIQTLFLFSIIFCLLLSLSVSSRSFLPQNSKTCTLNVTTSVQLAVSFSPVTDQPDNYIDSTGSTPSMSLTLKLHHRDLLHNSIHKDYKSRVLDQLERDSARVNSLQTRLDQAVRRTAKSDLKPLLTTSSGGLQSPIVSGTSQGSGEYFSRVGIGHPPRQLYVVIDTGSDVSWVQCEPCSVCYSQSDPVFNPATSSSFFSLSCDSPQCRALDVSECRSQHCLYEVSYGDGSYTVGDFATETITFDGGANGSAALESVAFGCGHTNEGLFVGAGGLLGLGGGTLSLPSQINATSFSYCLVDRDSNSASTLEFNPEVDSLSRNSANVISAPLVKNPQLDTFYYVGMTGISVGGEFLEVPSSAFVLDGDGNGGVIIDSGTAVTRLEESVYESLRDEFRRGAAHLPTAEGVAIFDTCFNLRGRNSVAVPAVVLEFAGGKRLPLPANNYMIPVDSEGTFCLAFAGTTSSMSIIGNVQQQGTRVVFDRVNSVIIFQPNKC